MTLITELSGSQWPLTGTATTVTSGLATLAGTGLVHVGSEDLPAEAIAVGATGYIQGAEGTVLTHGLDSYAAAYSGGNTYYWECWMRYVRTGTTDTGERRWIDYNGDGMRYIVQGYSRGDAGQLLYISAFSGGGTPESFLYTSSSVGPATIPHNEWFKMGFYTDFTAGAGVIKVFLNDTLAAQVVGITGLTGNTALGEAVAALMGGAGLTPQICGPYKSYDALPSIAPQRQAYREGDNSLDSWSVDSAGLGAGAHWPTVSTTGATTYARTSYTNTGTNPRRNRVVYNSNGAATMSSQPLGSLRYNELGWCSLNFQMTYLPGTSTHQIALRNAANSADVIGIEFTGSEIRWLGTDEAICTMSNAARYQVVLSLSEDGQASATVHNLTSIGDEQYVWSAMKSGGWSPQILGPIQQRTVVADGAPEIDGVQINLWTNCLGLDSMVAAAATSVTPTMMQNNRTAINFQKFAAESQVPNGAQQRTTWGAACDVYSFILGRPGRNSQTFTANALAGMNHSRGLRFVFLDGASINDLTGVNDANRAEKLATWKANRAAAIETLVNNGNRVLLTTMIRREQGTYTATQLREIDAMNGVIRELYAGYWQQSSGQPLLSLADIAYQINDHAAYFTVGDDVHFNTASDLDYANKIRTLETANSTQVYLGAIVPDTLAENMEKKLNVSRARWQEDFGG